MKSGLRLSAGEVESHGYTDVGKAVGFGLALDVLFTNTHSKVILRRFFPGAQYGYYPPQIPKKLNCRELKRARIPTKAPAPFYD